MDIEHRLALREERREEKREEKLLRSDNSGERRTYKEGMEATTASFRRKRELVADRRPDLNRPGKEEGDATWQSGEEPMREEKGGEDNFDSTTSHLTIRPSEGVDLSKRGRTKEEWKRCKEGKNVSGNEEDDNRFELRNGYRLQRRGEREEAQIEEKSRHERRSVENGRVNNNNNNNNDDSNDDTNNNNNINNEDKNYNNNYNSDDISTANMRRSKSIGSVPGGKSLFMPKSQDSQCYKSNKEERRGEERSERERDLWSEDIGSYKGLSGEQYRGRRWEDKGRREGGSEGENRWPNGYSSGSREEKNERKRGKQVGDREGRPLSLGWMPSQSFWQ